MSRIIIIICAMLYSAIASANPPRVHIEQLLPIEQCVYKAKLGAAGSWLRIEKRATSCADIKYYWHGDETEYELELVQEGVCLGFEMNKDPIKTGDIIYLDCIKKLQQ